MADLPSGTVTLLFTDIEGSTRLARELGDGYAGVLAEHDRLVRSALAGGGGQEVDTQGDSFLFAFPTASRALVAAVEAQKALESHPWPDGAPLHVRMGLHTAELEPADGRRYVGLEVHRAARIAAAGHGGQILLSSRTRDMVAGLLPEHVSIEDLGRHRLRDIEGEERLHQVVTGGLRSEFPALRAVVGAVKLPAAPTSFVGRAAELAAIEEAAAEETGRLLTLTGPGGSGKTRLAVEAAARRATQYRDGAFFVALSTVRDPEAVPARIAEVLGLHEMGGGRPMEHLKRHLRDRQVLLVLDNVEQVTASGPALADLLQAAPGLHLMVTSRAALHVYGEREIPVPPLGLPSDDDDVTTISRSDAVELFVDRARAVRPGFTLTPENAGDLANIARRTDGLPLAIELAASRVRVLSARELAERLARRLQLLTGGATDLPARQQTLRATIDWSYDLLDEPERALFRRLGCFVGGWTLESAMAVVDPGGRLGQDMLDGLESLLDKSLIRSDAGHDGGTRFRMLETLREYALDVLDERGERDSVRRRHALHHLEWAERARAALDAGDVAQLPAFDAEHANLQAAIEWAVTTSDEDGGEVALRLVTALGWYWYTRGHTLVALNWLEPALQRGAEAPALLRAKPWYWLGAVLDRRGDLARARAAMQASVELWREIGDEGKLATALNGLAAVAEDQGDFGFAARTYEESLARYRRLGDDTGTATVLSGLGTVALSDGRREDAERILRESHEIFTGLQDTWSTAVVEVDLAWAALERDASDEAAALADSATRAFRELGEQSYLAACLELHAAVAARAGVERAARLLGAAHALRESVGAYVPDRQRRLLERHTSAVRARLGDGFQPAFEGGAAASAVEILDEVLAGGGSSLGEHVAP